MIRTIKFRGWKDDRTFVTGSLLYPPEAWGDKAPAMMVTAWYDGRPVPVHTVDEFANIEDSIGNELYENDLVELDYGRYYVAWHNAAWWLFYDIDDEPWKPVSELMIDERKQRIAGRYAGNRHNF